MSGAISQSGPVVVGHVPVFIGNGTVQDAGPADGGFITQIGITNDGLLAFGINTGIITGPYTQFGAQVSSNGTVTLSAQSFNGGPSANVVWDINGVQYPLNPTGNGNISGPTISVDGDLLSFNGTNGNLVKDSGIPSARVVQGPTPTTIGHLATFNNAVGTLLADSGIPLASIVTGPGASVDDNIVLFDGVGGNVLEDSGVGLASLVPITSSKLIPPVSNIAALQAATSGTLPQGVCYVEGYYGLNDGGEGTFATGTPTTANGGTIINDASARSWYRAGAKYGATIFHFGAKGDGATDDWTAWQNAINVIQGTSATLYFPACVSVVSLQLTITAPIKIQGAGSGAGPGLLTTAGVSVLLCKATFTSGDVFNATGYYQFIFRDFQIAGALGLTYLSPSPRTTGAAIRISAPNPGTSTNLRSIIQNVAFSGFYECIHCTLCADQMIESCYFQAWKNAAYAEDEGGSTPESAGGSFTKNKLFGDPSPGTTQVAGIHIENGYTWIRGNTILGSQYGIRVQIQGAVASATHLISNNALEEQTVKSIEYSFTANTIVSVLINNNEFSQIANVAAFQSHISFVDPGFGFDGNISIAGNTINSFITNAGCVMINIQAGFNVTVNNNVINNNSAVGLGAVFSTGGHLGGVIAILDNLVNGVTLGNIYNLAAITKVRDKINSLTFATLGAWGNGSEVYVTDGAATGATNSILVGSGSGATASRARGNWYTNQYGVTG